ncbi:hypothetical protein KUCAC02_003467, partial [Chaenocephalus aceratus]
IAAISDPTLRCILDCLLLCEYHLLSGKMAATPVVKAEDFGNLCLLEAAEGPVDCRSFYWLYSEARFLSLSAVELLPPRVSPLSGQYLHAASDDQCRVNTSQTPASLCSH